MDLSIVIVSWNTKDHLKENLSRIFLSETGFQFEVFVVDNASRDNTAEMVAADFPQVHLISNQSNVGFSAANNQALRQAQGDLVLLLNPDMKPLKSTLDNMIHWMKLNRSAAAAGCRLLDEKGWVVKHVRRFPTAWNQLAIVLKLPYFFPHIIDSYLGAKFDYDYPTPVDTVRGGFLMIRKEVFKAVLPEDRFERGEFLDERFFVWFEDVDFCRTLKESGKELWYTPAASCIDLVGQSFKQLTRVKAQKLFKSSMLKYFDKWHHGSLGNFLLRLAWPWGMFLTWFFTAVGFESKKNT
jgi:N-acetylglucosaminyl-diphospho-decaprenol L-rhamnosyltransferase